jgi:hypothetical protein
MGLAGIGVEGDSGSVNTLQVGAGGGAESLGDTTFDNVNVSGNTASTANNDVAGLRIFP